MPGQYYSVKIGGEDWPAVICDEEIVQTSFKDSNRSLSARQADGTWGTDYKAGGKYANEKSCPVLILGTLQLSWPKLKDLEPLDVSMGEVIQETTVNALLARAWGEAIANVKANRGIDYWKQRLVARQIAAARPVESNDNTPLGHRKRKGTPKFKFPPGYAREETDDDEGEDIFLPPADIAGPKIKNEASNSTSDTEPDTLHNEPGTPQFRGTSSSSKRSKLNAAGYFSVLPGTPVKNKGASRLGTPLAASMARATPSQSGIKTDTTDQSKVLIYVGNPHQKFRCKRSALNASPLLSSLAIYHPGIGWYVMSPMLSNIVPTNFRPIGEYLGRGEYNPNLIDEGTEWVRFERELMGCERSQEVIRCGKVYSTAQDLELPGLQDLAFRKLKALGKHEPYQAFAILCVVDLVFEVGKEDLRDYLLHYLADHYWAIITAETKKTAEVMQRHKELATGVFGLLSGYAIPDSKVEENQEIKSEEPRDFEIAPASSEPSGETVQVDDTGEEKDDLAATEEMVRIAMSQSDEHMTEEEITKTILEQSQFF